MERKDATLDSLKQTLETLSLKYEDKDTPQNLLHYTDTVGLLGILDSQQLWATHAFYLNDATEINYTYELIEEIYHDLIEQAKPDGKARADSNSPLWTYRDFLHRLSYKTARAKPNPDVYVTCFCEKDDLLSQWRGYGNRGSGYAIGFDTKRLIHPSYSFKLCKVIYSREKQNQILNEILRVVRDSFKRMTDGMDVDGAESLTEAHAMFFEETVTRYAPFFKHPTFHEEQEWRLIYSPTGDAYSNQIKFRSGNLGIIPYVKIGVPDSKKKDQLPIVSIRIGPTAQPALARKALEMVAVGKYPDLKISGSAIPLR